MRIVVLNNIRINEIKGRINAWHLRLLMLLFLPVFSVNANDILKDVSFTDIGEEIEIKVKLAVPFNYAKHFPSKRGKIIQIQLEVDPEKVDSKKTKRRETIKPASTSPLNIRDVIFEGNVRGGPYLVIRFMDVIKFRVNKIVDKQSISVYIEKSTIQSVKESPKKPLTAEDKKLKEVDQLMRDARFALTNGKNAEAILLFSKLLSMPEHKHIIDSKEYLGLARERNGQLEMAKKEYEEYLKIYPKKPRTNTVKQRLMTLNARLSAPRKQLKESKRTLASRKKNGQRRMDIFGRFSQIYYTAFINKERSSTTNQQKLLLTFLDANWRLRDANKEVRFVFSGSHEEDFKAGDREPRIRSLFADYNGKKNGLQLTIGRQTVNSGGVLGRFDGAVFGFNIRRKYRAYLVAGYPVDFVDHMKFQTNKPMLGGRLDIKGLFPHWQSSAYVIHQWVDSMTNRFALGADARYFNNGKIFYSLVDFDVSYQTLNFLTLHYGWQVTKKTKLDFHFDRRQSPVMLTSNALQGLSSVQDPQDLGENISGDVTMDEIKADLSISKLQEIGMTDEEIRQRAIDNTGKSTLVTVSLRQGLRKDLELNASVTLNRYEPGVSFARDIDRNSPPVDSSFISISTWDKVLNAQLIQRNFFKPRDILIGGLRYSNNKNSLRYEASGTIRYPFKSKWWIDFKTRFMYTTSKNDEKSAVRINPKLRVEYRLNKKLTLEGDVGTEINNSQIEGEDYTWTSANFGFRFLF